MSGWRKPRNRRLDRGSVLDVKVRAAPSRQARRQMILLALGLAVLAVVGTALAFRGWEIVRHRLLDSKLFALTSIEITSDEVWLTREQIRHFAGVHEGENLLQIDMSRIRRDLQLIPQVESVAVERVLPHVLRLQVTEREPVLQIHAIQPEGRDGMAPVVFYLDREAVVMPPLPSTRVSPNVVQSCEALPVLRGISNAELRPGVAIRSRTVQAALRLLDSYEPSPLAAWVELGVIDIASPDVMRVTTRQGAEVILPYEQIEQAVDRWHLVHEAGARSSRAVASLNLAVTNNCPVLWLEASLVPPPRLKPAKPQRPHRKHV